MFSFVGDTVLDPFMGTGTTNCVVFRWGRNSIGIEIDQVIGVGPSEVMSAAVVMTKWARI
jgi:hypothetical protein